MMSLKGDNSDVSCIFFFPGLVYHHGEEKMGESAWAFQRACLPVFRSHKISGTLGNSFFALLTVLHVSIKIHSENCNRFKEIK